MLFIQTEVLLICEHSDPRMIVSVPASFVCHVLSGGGRSLFSTICRFLLEVTFDTLLALFYAVFAFIHTNTLSMFLAVYHLLLLSSYSVNVNCHSFFIMCFRYFNCPFLNILVIILFKAYSLLICSDHA